MKDLNLYPLPNPLPSPPPAQMLLLSHNTPFLPLSMQAQHRGPEKMTHMLGNGKVHLPTNQPRCVLCSPLSQWQPTQWGLDGRLSCTPGTWQHVHKALWPSWVLYPVVQAVYPWNTLGTSDHLISFSSWPHCLMEVSIRTRPEMSSRLSGTGFGMSFRASRSSYDNHGEEY